MRNSHRNPLAHIVRDLTFFCLIGLCYDYNTTYLFCQQFFTRVLVFYFIVLRNFLKNLKKVLTRCKYCDNIKHIKHIGIIDKGAKQNEYSFTCKWYDVYMYDVYFG